MIKEIKGNIFDSKCNVLVNPVNCMGVMGSGLAKQFKDIYIDSEMFKVYKYWCDKDMLKVGFPMVWCQGLGFFKKRYKSVLLFPIKNYYKDKSQLFYIEEGLKNFVKQYKEEKTYIGNIYYYVESIAFPELCCGLGGLEWEDVKKLMYKYLSDIDLYIEIYI